MGNIGRPQRRIGVWAALLSDQGGEKNRVEKMLEDAQIKLSVVASDLRGLRPRHARRAHRRRA